MTGENTQTNKTGTLKVCTCSLVHFFFSQSSQISPTVLLKKKSGKVSFTQQEAFKVVSNLKSLIFQKNTMTRTVQEFSGVEIIQGKEGQEVINGRKS